MDAVENERRMVRMETQQESIIELLQEIKSELRNQPYVPRDEINAMLSLRDDRIQKLEDEFKAKRTNVIAWMGVLIAVVSAIASILQIVK